MPASDGVALAWTRGPREQVPRVSIPRVAVRSERDPQANPSAGTRREAAVGIPFRPVVSRSRDRRSDLDLSPHIAEPLPRSVLPTRRLLGRFEDLRRPGSHILRARYAGFFRLLCGKVSHFTSIGYGRSALRPLFLGSVALSHQPCMVVFVLDSSLLDGPSHACFAHPSLGFDRSEACVLPCKIAVSNFTDLLTEVEYTRHGAKRR